MRYSPYSKRFHSGLEPTEAEAVRQAPSLIFANRHRAFTESSLRFSSMADGNWTRTDKSFGLASVESAAVADLDDVEPSCVGTIAADAHDCLKGIRASALLQLDFQAQNSNRE